MRIMVLLKATIYIIALGMLAICFVLLPELAREEIASNPKAVTAPYLFGAYVLATPIFAALYQTLKLARLIERNQAFTPAFVQTLRAIKYRTVVFAFLVIIGAIISIFVARRDNPTEDVTHIIALAAIFTFASTVVATAVSLFQRLFQNAVEIKAENDLIV